jgi:ribosomal protein S18 acetylase RimI-like enzyme
MSVSSSISRFTVYCKRNGLRATVRRVGQAAWRAFFSSRMVLFYCDLSMLGLATADLQGSLNVERYKKQTDLSLRDLEEMTSFWNSDQARRNIEERFELGASLWLIKIEDKLAGYGWTLQGHTVEPHFFRLGPDDVHLFDFYVFPQYRGRGLNPFLVGFILRSAATESQGRAFIEAAEWNQAQLASLQRTPFRRLGSARKFTIFRHTIVHWGSNESVQQAQGTSDKLSAPTAHRRMSAEKG